MSANRGLGARFNLIIRLSRSVGEGRWSFKSVVALLLFSAIVMVFIFFGFPRRETGGYSTAAQVNNAFVSLADLKRQMEQMERYYSQLMGGGGGNVDAQRQFILSQSLESLIEQELMAQLAVRNRIEVSDAEVRRMVTQEMGAFQESGRFSRERYLALLQQNFLTPAEFETRVRKGIATERLQALFERAAKPLGLEKEKLDSLRKAQIRLQHVSWRNEELAKKIKVNSEKVKQSLTEPKFRQRVEVSFQSQANRWGEGEKARVRHLLIKFTSGDEKGKKAALQRIRDLKSQITSENFAEIARKNSQDFSVSQNSGDLGFIERGSMPAAFEQVAFSAPLNSLSDPVETESGYHLIQVLEKKPAVKAELAKVEASIAQELLARDEWEAQMSKLKTWMQEKKEPLISEWMRSQGLKWTETEWMDLSLEAIPGISAPERFTLISELSPQRPYPSRLLESEGESTLLRLKDVRSRPTTNKDLASKDSTGSPSQGKIKDKGKTSDSLLRESDASLNLAQNRGSEIFRQWMSSEKKDAKIVRNSAALRP
ncbi:MAG: SurA N-terminal domain-containing protein [Bdellovibrio sp.]